MQETTEEKHTHSIVSEEYLKDMLIAKLQDNKISASESPQDTETQTMKTPLIYLRNCQWSKITQISESSPAVWDTDK